MHVEQKRTHVCMILTEHAGCRDALRSEWSEAKERARRAEGTLEVVCSERDAALGEVQAAAELSKAAERERADMLQRGVATSSERDAALEVGSGTSLAGAKSSRNHAVCLPPWLLAGGTLLEARFDHGEVRLTGFLSPLFRLRKLRRG